jgi:hypothetical protein
MTAPKRFFYVAAPGSVTTHRTYANSCTEGIRTDCGVLVRAGWLYGSQRSKTAKLCRRCGP